ncbi:MAG TPA: hypothetical protein VJV05_13755 [Pyrinomonadaceae bacterium]|nr:hypothetical protein [Pyrinomonadaceae bacterium]
MSKRNKDVRVSTARNEEVNDRPNGAARRWSKWLIAAFALLSLLTIGVFASNGWFPSTDSLTGRRTGWFGQPLAKNSASSWNPLAAPLPTPAPQLSKELIYAGGRLVAVEDVNANAAPPADLAIWRPSTGGWWVLSGTGSVNQNWGASGDVPVEGDYS